MLNPKVSFVMPVKNRGDMIAESIETILKQTVSDWELIIADDHSDESDQTRDIVQKFNDERIRYVRIPDNWPFGIATARNFGNQFARANIICVADSDDYQKPKRAEIVMNVFKDNKCDACYGDFDVLIKSTGEIREPYNEVIPFDIEKFKKGNFIAHGTVSYLRKVAYSFPYNSFFLKGEDYDLTSRMAANGLKIYFCPEKMFTYVVHDSNISEGRKQPEWEEIIWSNRDWQPNNEEVYKKIGINRDETGRP